MPLTSAITNSNGLVLNSSLAGTGLNMTTSGNQILSLDFGTITSTETQKAVSGSTISSALAHKQNNLTFGLTTGNALKAASTMSDGSFVFTQSSGNGLVTKNQSEALDLLGLNTETMYNSTNLD